MKRVFAMLLVLCLVVSLVPVSASAATTSGTCGENLKWKYSNGTLTITGTGEMDNFQAEGNRPGWESHKDSITKVVISEGVTSVGNYAFYCYNSLEEVIFPESLENIYLVAFAGCGALTKITFPQEMDTIDGKAFNCCSALKEVTLPRKMKVIAMLAFGGCTGLEKVTLPDDVEYIELWAFNECTSLKQVVIPDGVARLGDAVFYGCTSLVSVKFPANMLDPYTSVDFSGCTSLSEVILPNNLLRMGSFHNCTSLKSIVIPEAVKDIVYNAFEGCTALKTVVFTGNPPAEGDFFKDLTLTAYYPADNANWTAAARQNYGGTVTWKALKDTKITTQPTTQKVKSGTTANFTVKATGTDLKYQWEYKETADAQWKNALATGNKTATLKVSATTGKTSYYYRCKITNALGDVKYSNAVRLYVLGIKTQPTTQKVKAGTTATFKVSATGLNKTYQWQYKTSADGNWLNCTAEGNKTATLKVAATTGKSSYYYRCKISDNGGNTIYTNTVRLYVLGIKTQPTTQKVKAGTTATFTVSATGSNKTYQWQYKTSESGTWKNCTAEGNKTATLKVSATTGKSSYYYRCKITDSAGNVIYTNVVRLYVLGITTQPAAKTAKAGTTVKFTVAATGAGKTYQWQYKAPNGTWKNTTATSAKTATLSVSVTASKNGYQYRCIVKDNAGNSVTSKTAKLTVK